MTVFSLSSMVLLCGVSNDVPSRVQDGDHIPCMLRLIRMKDCVSHGGQIQCRIVLKRRRAVPGRLVSCVEKLT